MKIEMGVDTNERKNDFLRKKFLKKNWKNFLPKLLERFLDQPEKPNLDLESDGRLERDLLALQD